MRNWLAVHSCTAPARQRCNHHICGEHAGSRADSSLEFVADHAGAAAHVALFHRAAMRGIKSMKNVSGFT